MAGKRAFADLRSQGRRTRQGSITVTFLADAQGSPPRIGFAIGRSVGNAVVRNRLRRRLREISRGVAPDLASGTFLIGVAPGAARLSFGELNTVVTKALIAAAQ